MCFALYFIFFLGWVPEGGVVLKTVEVRKRDYEGEGLVDGWKEGPK